MTRFRVLLAAVAVLALLSVAALASNTEEADAQILPPAVTAAPTTTTTAPPPPPPEPPPPPKPVVKRGDDNADVQAAQQRLKDLGYDPGDINGKFGAETMMAVWALQKSHGLPPTGEIRQGEHDAMAKAEPPRKLAEHLGPDRVEVDLTQQTMTIYRGNIPHLISHVSTGNQKRYCHRGGRRCGYAITPRGDWRISSMARGWITAPLGRLYNPATFTRSGHALHGSLSVPLGPASHGCVRVPMHTAKWMPALLFRGMPVHVGG